MSDDSSGIDYAVIAVDHKTHIEHFFFGEYMAWCESQGMEIHENFWKQDLHFLQHEATSDNLIGIKISIDEFRRENPKNPMVARAIRHGFWTTAN